MATSIAPPTISQPLAPLDFSSAQTRIDRYKNGAERFEHAKWAESIRNIDSQDCQRLIDYVDNEFSNFSKNFSRNELYICILKTCALAAFSLLTLNVALANSKRSRLTFFLGCVSGMASITSLYAVIKFSNQLQDSSNFLTGQKIKNGLLKEINQNYQKNLQNMFNSVARALNEVKREEPHPNCLVQCNDALQTHDELDNKRAQRSALEDAPRRKKLTEDDLERPAHQGEHKAAKGHQKGKDQQPPQQVERPEQVEQHLRIELSFLAFEDDNSKRFLSPINRPKRDHPERDKMAQPVHAVDRESVQQSNALQRELAAQAAEKRRTAAESLEESEQ